MVETAEKTLSEKVCELIGYDAMEVLCSQMGGLRWDIPKHPPQDLRDGRIRQECSNLVTLGRPYCNIYRALATKYRLTERRIREIVNL